MTPEELREKVARAIGSSLLDGALHFDWRVHLEEADAALSVVSEAMREPSEEMMDRGVAFALNVKIGSDYGWTPYVRDMFTTMLAASPLAEPKP